MNKTNLFCENEMKKLYWAHYQDLCMLAVIKIRDSEVANDIVQEFFINYWERCSRGFSAPDNFIGYAKRSIRNLSIDYLRRKTVLEKKKMELLTLDQEPSPYGEESESEVYYKRLEVVYELIERLPKGQREILKLHALDRLTYAQIASKQGISINTVRTQLSRAYSKLRKSTSGLILLSLLECF